MYLTTAQDQVLALLSAGSSISDAAESVGLHRNTVHNWVRSVPNFRLALARAREAKALYWREQAEQLVPAALDAIRAIMGDPKVPAGVRLKAAQSIMNIAMILPAPLPTFYSEICSAAEESESVHNSAQCAPSIDDLFANIGLPAPETVHNPAQPPAASIDTLALPADSETPSAQPCTILHKLPTASTGAFEDPALLAQLCAPAQNLGSLTPTPDRPSV